MISRGCYIFTLLVSYVLSVPLPSDQEDKDDVKVMKCIVEVIADTLTKPHPIGISQECQDSLTGDERIISILRHQNLLKELQDIAAQGVSERAQQKPQKKSEDEGDQMREAIGGHPGMEDTTDRYTLREGAAERRGAGEEDNEVEEESQEKGGESREGNQIGGTKEGEEEEEGERQAEEREEENPGNHISDSLNQGQEEEEREEEEEEKTAPAEEEDRHSSSGEEEGKGKEENETEDDDGVQVSKGGESEPLRGDPEAKSEESQSDEEEEDEMEGGPESKEAFEGAEVENRGKEVVAEEAKGGPDIELRSKTDEVSPQQPSEDAEEDDHLGTGEKDAMGAGQGGPQLLKYAPHHSKEDSAEGGRRSPEAQALHMMAHGEVEEKRDEEGSASRRVEDHEIERLAAIESELESVAQRLHELRRG